MTTDRDMDRLLGRFFEAGPDSAPDRMLDVLADRIDRQPQQPAWRLDRRLTRMNPYIKIGAAIAAVLLIGVIGWNLLPARQGLGQPGPSATPIPTADPLPTPEAALAPGRYFQLPGPRKVSFDVPAGWRLTEAWSGGLAFTPATGEAGDSIHVFYDMRPASRDAACTEVPQSGFGGSAHELLAGVASTPGAVATPAQPFTIGGANGESIDVSMAPGWTHACPFSSGNPTVPLIVDTITNAEGPFWGLAPGEKERLIAFDVPGWSNVVILVDSLDGSTFDAIAAEAMPFARSFDVEVGATP